MKTQIREVAAGLYMLTLPMPFRLEHVNVFAALEEDGFTLIDTGPNLTGTFPALEADLDEFGELSLKAERPAKISSLCTVFAESEVISLISKGETRENIIAGIHEAIASRVAAMANRIGLAAPVMMTGGVARNIGVVRALEKAIGMSVVVSPHAQVAGAIGAASLAQELKNA